MLSLWMGGGYPEMDVQIYNYAVLCCTLFLDFCGMSLAPKWMITPDDVGGYHEHHYTPEDAGDAILKTFIFRFNFCFRGVLSVLSYTHPTWCLPSGWTGFCALTGGNGQEWTIATKTASWPKQSLSAWNKTKQNAHTCFQSYFTAAKKSSPNSSSKPHSCN